MFSLLIINAVQAQVHAYDLIHRDLKSENVMVDVKNTKVSIIDYSFSKDMRDPLDQPNTKGTLGLTPPEQLFLEGLNFPEYTLSADYYTLGKKISPVSKQANIAQIGIYTRSGSFLGAKQAQIRHS